MMMKYSQLLITFVFFNTACSDLNTLDSTGQGHEKLLYGQLTDERPEVVRLSLIGGGLCTGTVIKSNVILTAAHCIDYQTAERNMGSIITGQGREYTIKGGFSFSQELGRTDVALLHLSGSIPSSEAIPAVVHAGIPSYGSSATIYGFGCNDRRTQGGNLLSQKQKYNFTIGERTGNLCPGDSGGPVFVNNAVAYINSAYHTDSGDDLFAEPSTFHEEVIRVATQISARGVAQYISGQNNSWGMVDDPFDDGDQDTGESGSPIDECEQSNFYGDGMCDTSCPRPDPDCRDQSNPDSGEGSQNDDGQSSNDECEDLGYYGDGVCDHFCGQPDPDCNNQQGQTEDQQGQSNESESDLNDECEQNNYYGDGFCDFFCERPDPDC